MKYACFVGFMFKLAVFSSLGSVFAESTVTVEQAEELVIGSIRVTGNVSIAGNEVLSRARSREGRLFNSATADEDAKRIAELAGVEYSYYNREVVDNKIRLTFVVVERNIVRSIVFAGNRKCKGKELRKKLESKVGEYLSPVTAESDRQALTDFYHKKGFAFVKVGLDSEKMEEGQLKYTIDEGARVRIDSITLSGNKALKTGALKKVVKTKKTRWLVLRAYYLEEHIDKDVDGLKETYYERGFLNVKVTPKLESTRDRSKVRITFVIEEGAAYTVGKIILSGNRYFDTKRLRRDLELKEGQVYNKRKADRDVERLVKLYLESGFVDVEVKENREFVSETENLVRVEFSITEGERFRIGQVNISGNEQTQDRVIRHVLDEYDFKPGEWYNADIARGDGSGELEKRIRRMVVTESAKITPSGEAARQRDAEVSIVEGRTGMVMLGAGVGSDSGAFGQVMFEQKNFDIKDKPKSFRDFITGDAFRGGGQTLRIDLRPGVEVSEYSISFTEPYFKNRPISLNLVGLSRNWERESYDENRLRGYIGFEKRYRNRWRRSIGFRVENVDVDSVESDAPQEINSVRGSNALMGVRLGVGRDLTDDEFNPTKGHVFRASYEQLGGDHTFGVLSGTYSRYKTVYVDLADRKTVLATKLHGATIFGDAPPFEKFYAGGARSIRGFDYRGVSTRGRPRNNPNAKKKDPIGSDWIFLANAEMTVPLVGKNLSALFFVDSGTIDSGNYRASVGTGIQIMLPQWFGPVPMRFEIATPLLKDGADETRVFSFSVGRLF